MQSPTRSVREDDDVPTAANTGTASHARDPAVNARALTRIGGGVGILSILLLLVAIATGPTKLINANSSAAQIINSLGAHTSQAAASDAVAVLGLTLFIWFAASLAHTLQVRDRGTPLGFVVLGAGIAVSVLGSLDNVMNSVLIFLAKQGGLATEPALTRTLYHLYNGLVMPGMVAFATAVYLAGIAFAALRSAIGRRWLGWLSLIFVPLSLVSGFVGLTVSDGGTSAAAPLGVLGFVLITVITGVFMVRDKPRTEPARREI